MTGDRSCLRAAATLLAWLAFLITTIVGLHALGGALAPPPLTGLGGLSGWVQTRKPAEAAFALLRLVALGTSWYLLAATMASALAQLSRVPAAVRAADMLAVPAVRRLVNAAAGVSVAAATLATGAATGSPGTAPLQYPAMENLAVQTAAGTDPADQPPQGIVGEPTESGAPSGAGGPDDHSPDEEMRELPTLRRLPDNDVEPPSPAGTTTQPGAPVAPAPAPSTSSTSSSPTTAVRDAPPVQWQVQPGQHFWAVAENVLESAWQRPPSDAEIDPYWRHLVETNRSILRDPRNPDLLYPGQVLSVPPPPPSPSSHRAVNRTR